MKLFNAFVYVVLIVIIYSCDTNNSKLYRITENGKTGFIDSKGKIKIAPSFDYISDFSEGLAAVAVHIDSLDVKDTLFNIWDKKSLQVTYRYVNKKGENSGIPEHTIVSTSYSYDMPQVEDLLHKVRFRNKRAVFQNEDGKYGYIDKKGKIVINPIFEKVQPFFDQYATVSQDGKTWGYINVDGSYFVKPQFDVLSDFSCGRGSAMIQQGPNHIDDKGAIVIPMYNQFLIDEDGRFIGEPISGYKNYYTFTEDGIAVAEHIIVGLVGYSFIDKNGDFLPVEEAPNIEDREYANTIKELKNEYTFKDVTRFTNGYAAVTLDGESWIFIDRYFVPAKKGNMILTYEGAGPFSSGLAAIKQEEKWGYIDTLFNEVIPCQYDSCSAFVGELAKVFIKRDNILIESYIDRNNSIVWQQLVKTETEEK